MRQQREPEGGSYKNEIIKLLAGQQHEVMVLNSLRQITLRGWHNAPNLAVLGSTR